MVQEIGIDLCAHNECMCVHTHTNDKWENVFY